MRNIWHIIEYWLKGVSQFVCIHRNLKCNPSLFKNCASNNDHKLKLLILNLTHYVLGIQVSNLGTIAHDQLK